MIVFIYLHVIWRMLPCTLNWGNLQFLWKNTDFNSFVSVHVVRVEASTLLHACQQSALRSLEKKKGKKNPHWHSFLVQHLLPISRVSRSCLQTQHLLFNKGFFTTETWRLIPVCPTCDGWWNSWSLRPVWKE